MWAEAYIADISAVGEDITRRYSDIEHHFVCGEGERLSVRKESLCGRLLLDKCLKEKGVTHYSVSYEKNKKPRLISDEEIFFNISHSGNFVALALSDSAVGCDIQLIKQYNPKVAKRNYCPEEMKLIEASEDRDSLFIKFWALKESVLKYTGEGLSGGLSSYDFSSCSEKEDFELFGLGFYVRKIENTYFALCYRSNDIIKSQLKLKGVDL